MFTNPDEMFDLVDQEDQVTGQEKRSIVHARGWRHRAVHILVFNLQGDVFLQKRSALKDTFPNCWDSSCSGHVDSGEEYLEAAMRELKEELGLEKIAPNRLEPLFKLEARPETGQEFIWVYRLQHEGPFILHPEEISEGRFFRLEEVTALLRDQPKEIASALLFLWPMLLKSLKA